jgi:hypothetical protein
MYTHLLLARMFPALSAGSVHRRRKADRQLTRFPDNNFLDTTRCPLAHKKLSVAYADIVTRYMYHRDASARAELTIIAQDLIKHTDETSA